MTRATVMDHVAMTPTSSPLTGRYMEAASVPPWGDSVDAREVSVEMALVKKPNRLCNFAREVASPQELPSARQAHMELKGVGWQPNVLPEGTNQLKATEASHPRQLVKRNVLLVVLLQEVPGFLNRHRENVARRVGGSLLGSASKQLTDA